MKTFTSFNIKKIRNYDKWVRITRTWLVFTWQMEEWPQDVEGSCDNEE